MSDIVANSQGYTKSNSLKNNLKKYHISGLAPGLDKQDAGTSYASVLENFIPDNNSNWEKRKGTKILFDITTELNNLGITYSNIDKTIFFDDVINGTNYSMVIVFIDGQPYIKNITKSSKLQRLPLAIYKEFNEWSYTDNNFSTSATYQDENSVGTINYDGLRYGFLYGVGSPNNYPRWISGFYEIFSDNVWKTKEGFVGEGQVGDIEIFDNRNIDLLSKSKRKKLIIKKHTVGSSIYISINNRVFEINIGNINYNFQTKTNNNNSDILFPYIFASYDDNIYEQTTSIQDLDDKVYILKEISHKPLLTSLYASNYRNWYSESLNTRVPFFKHTTLPRFTSKKYDYTTIDALDLVNIQTDLYGQRLIINENINFESTVAPVTRKINKIHINVVNENTFTDLPIPTDTSQDGFNNLSWYDFVNSVNLDIFDYSQDSNIPLNKLAITQESIINTGINSPEGGQKSIYNYSANKVINKKDLGFVTAEKQLGDEVIISDLQINFEINNVLTDLLYDAYIDSMIKYKDSNDSSDLRHTLSFSLSLSIDGFDFLIPIFYDAKLVVNFADFMFDKATLVSAGRILYGSGFAQTPININLRTNFKINSVDSNIVLELNLFNQPLLDGGFTNQILSFDVESFLNSWEFYGLVDIDKNGVIAQHNNFYNKKDEVLFSSVSPIYSGGTAYSANINLIDYRESLTKTLGDNIFTFDDNALDNGKSDAANNIRRYPISLMKMTSFNSEAFDLNTSQLYAKLASDVFKLDNATKSTQISFKDATVTYGLNNPEFNTFHNYALDNPVFYANQKAFDINTTTGFNYVSITELTDSLVPFISTIDGSLDDQSWDSYDETIVNRYQNRDVFLNSETLSFISQLQTFSSTPRAIQSTLLEEYQNSGIDTYGNVVKLLNFQSYLIIVYEKGLLIESSASKVFTNILKWTQGTIVDVFVFQSKLYILNDNGYLYAYSGSVVNDSNVLLKNLQLEEYIIGGYNLKQELRGDILAIKDSALFFYVITKNGIYRINNVYNGGANIPEIQKTKISQILEIDDFGLLKDINEAEFFNIVESGDILYFVLGNIPFRNDADEIEHVSKVYLWEKKYITPSNTATTTPFWYVFTGKNWDLLSIIDSEITNKDSFLFTTSSGKLLQYGFSIDGTQQYVDDYNDNGLEISYNQFEAKIITNLIGSNFLNAIKLHKLYFILNTKNVSSTFRWDFFYEYGGKIINNNYVYSSKKVGNARQIKRKGVGVNNRILNISRNKPSNSETNKDEISNNTNKQYVTIQDLNNTESLVHITKFKPVTTNKYRISFGHSDNAPIVFNQIQTDQTEVPRRNK